MEETKTQDSSRQRLLELNRRFYEAAAHRFSATRQRPWQGWLELLPDLRSQEPLRSCLDLGCGNGRFAAFLEAEGLLPKSYLGVDGSAALLQDASACLPSPPCKLLQLGFEDLPAKLEGEPFDLLVLFGVLHHFPGTQARKAWLELLSARLAPGGLLIFSIWLLDRFPERFAKLRRDPTGLKLALEPGDALLSFDGRADVLRYCHFPNDAEIAELCDLPGCRELRRFRADGPSGADNLYVVLRQDEAGVLSSAAPERSAR